MINVDTTAAHSGTDTLFDGTLITVRPITSEDASALEAFHGRLSQRSVYLRYFYPHPDLSAKEIEHLTRVDGRDRLALVVEHAGELVAVGRYERLPASQDAEVAFVVSDALQDHGIGTLLLARLAVAARSVGITRFIAEVLAENRGMLSFLCRAIPNRNSSRLWNRDLMDVDRRERGLESHSTRHTPEYFRAP
jgi:GNAT superfamily N-acetyltransferase